jgi:hypothetical protein
VADKFAAQFGMMHPPDDDAQLKWYGVEHEGQSVKSFVIPSEHVGQIGIWDSPLMSIRLSQKNSTSSRLVCFVSDPRSQTGWGTTDFNDGSIASLVSRSTGWE